jgi:bifunctional non-homologous end joining protein LigD
VQADAVWDSRNCLAAEERKADRGKKVKTVPAREVPDFIAPHLCETLDRPPSADGWIQEIKFDGYRDSPLGNRAVLALATARAEWC